MSGSEAGYKDIFSLNHDPLLVGYSPVFGSMKINTAFHFAIGAMMLKNQCVYPCPVLDNPFNANICTTFKHKNIGNVSCLKFIKDQGFSELVLSQCHF